MATHTPGPWEIDGGDGMPIAKVGFHFITAPCEPNIGTGLSRDEIDGNACVIATAPDLLAALKECSFRLAALVAVIGDFSNANALALDAATAAINGAEGRKAEGRN